MPRSASRTRPDADGSADPGRPGAPSLPARLNALARLVQIGSARGGPDGFDPDLLEEAADLLGRAGERLRLSGAHTVVTLAGGTGSGKSSLFNALAGANFSPVGVIRPTTGEPHACVWGMAGAGPLLDWARDPAAAPLRPGQRPGPGRGRPDRPAAARPARSRLGDGRRVARGGPPGRPRGPDDLGGRPAEVRGRGRAQPLPGPVRRSLRGHHGPAQPVRPAQLPSSPRNAWPTCAGCSTPRACTTRACWRPPLPPGRALDELRQVLVEAVAARRAAGQRIEADVDTLAGRFEAYAAERRGGRARGRRGRP